MQTAQRITFALFFATLATAACSSSSSGPSSSDGGTPEKGKESYSPPGTTGGSKPADATDVTCKNSSECAYWYCRCEDGAVVNSAKCDNGYCLNAKGACPDACTTFNHGKWTGEAGGGPSTPANPGNDGGTTTGGCDSFEQCPKLACVCQDGTVVSTRSCTNRVCDGEADACPDACFDHGGY